MLATRYADYFDGLVFGGDRAPVLILRLVADESHDERKQRTMSMGGLLGPRDLWGDLIVKWVAALAEESVNPKHAPDCLRLERKVDVFHAADCESANGDFEGWCRPRIESLQRRLISLILRPEYGLLGYAAGVPIKPHSLIRPTLRRRMWLRGSVNGPLDDPWFYVLQVTLQTVAADPHAYPPDEPIQCLFDQHNLAERGKFIFQVLKGLPRNQVRLSGGIAFGDRKRLIPLQAADLFAYEVFRRHDGREVGEPERWQYAALRPVIRIDAFLDGDHLQSSIAAVERRMEELEARGEFTPSPLPQPRKPKNHPPKVGRVERVRRWCIRTARRIRRAAGR